MTLSIPTQLVPAGFRNDLARWRQLVGPGWLASLVARNPAEASPSADWRLFEVGFGALEKFVSGHIPGAGYIDTRELEEEPLWNKVPDHDLLLFLLGNGIRHDTTVVLYDRNTLAAARAAHLMLYAGVRDVRMLDGGLKAWNAASLPLAHGLPPARQAKHDFGAVFPARPDHLMDTRQIRVLPGQPDGALVSIRTRNEFAGKTSGYSFIKAKGEIPGARWGRAGQDGDVNSMSEYQHADGTMKPSSVICKFWGESGVHADQQVAFYCGTGWRASLAFFYAWLMGWQRISVYDGGWFEWSSDLANPVVCRDNF